MLAIIRAFRQYIAGTEPLNLDQFKDEAVNNKLDQFNSHRMPDEVLIAILTPLHSFDVASLKSACRYGHVLCERKIKQQWVQPIVISLK